MLRSCLETKILVKDDANEPFCNDVFSLDFFFRSLQKDNNILETERERDREE